MVLINVCLEANIYLQKIERSFIQKQVKDITPITVFYYSTLLSLSLKMPSTRSGINYNSIASSKPIVSSSTQARKSPRFEGKIHQTSRPAFFEPVTTTQNTRPQRANRTAFPAELIREYCNDSDNDSTSDYEMEDEEVQQYTRDSFISLYTPKYDVDIDFDEASTAWRANKRRVGESWVYKLNPKHPENFKFEIVDDAVKSVTAHVSANIASSVASRVKQNRRHNFESKL